MLPYIRVILKCLRPKGKFPEPRTIGEHIQKRRLELGLTQKEAADQLRVTAVTLLHWEKWNTQPAVKSMPAILSFLGYYPFPVPQILSERMLAVRRANGWTIKEAARHLGVDEGTWGRWERTAYVY